MSNVTTSSAILLSLLLTACANYASFQEADTTPKGTSTTGFGATYTTYEVEVNDTRQDVGVPALNLWHRRGFTDKLEGHATVWIPLGASLGVKYQLLGRRATNGLAMSLGADLGFLQISAEDSEGNTSKATIVDAYLPIYLGYRISPTFAAYLSPKYILRVASSESGSAAGHLGGATLGAAIGSGTTLHLEGTVMYDHSVGAPAAQGGIGVAF